VLLALIVATTTAFFRIDRIAGWLMVPYVAWVAFATVLTAAIFRLN
jgi:translocator protein